jgi:hypothetical protein
MTAHDDLTTMPPAASPHDETSAKHSLRPTTPAEDTTGVITEPPADGPDDDLFEPDWDKPKRTNKLTWVLVALLVAALAFAGGVTLQKNHDEALAVAAAGTRARADQSAALGIGGGGGAGGAGGGVGSSSGSGGGSGGTGSGSGGAQSGSGSTTGGSGGTAAATPVAIGTVKSISGTTFTLTNFAETVVTVTVPPTATVTTNGLQGLVVGATVSVAGTTSADGNVTATSVTSRKTG